jgi:hypothetical protein
MAGPSLPFAADDDDVAPIACLRFLILGELV